MQPIYATMHTLTLWPYNADGRDAGLETRTLTICQHHSDGKMRIDDKDFHILMRYRWNKL